MRRRRSPLVALLAAAALVAATADASTAAAADVAAAGAVAPTAVPLQHVAVRGASLGYRDLNPDAPGRPLVLIAGYGVTMAEWHPAFVERLARHRRTILFDNRGIGTSTGPVRGLSVASMAADTAALIRRLGLGRADVLGWSMGGYIAQRLAIDAPRRVGRLVLAASDPGSPHAIAPSQRVVDVLTDPDTTPTELLPILFPADQLAAGQAWLTAIGSQPNLSAADFATPAATIAAQGRATGERWYRRHGGTYGELPRIRARTLVAHGTEDVIVPPGNARLLGQRIRNAQVRVWTDAGHAFLFQRPTRMAAVFARFLSAGR